MINEQENEVFAAQLVFAVNLPKKKRVVKKKLNVGKRKRRTTTNTKCFRDLQKNYIVFIKM